MSYATPQDFINYFGEQESLEISNLDNPMATTIDMTLIQRSLDHATSEINAYISGNYTLPLVSVPSILLYDTCEIARFRMDKYRTREDVQQRYELVIARLRDIAKGIINLGLDLQSKEVTGEIPGEPDYVSAPPVFTMSSLADF